MALDELGVDPRRGDLPQEPPGAAGAVEPGVGSQDLGPLVGEVQGPQRVRELVALGAEFDRDAEGQILLTREGGHHRDRIAHAGGDATGKEISRALIEALHRVQSDPNIQVIEHALVVDLLQSDDDAGGPGRVCGVTVHVIGEGQVDGVGAAHARAVVLATGGLGQLFTATTNPSVATGDGMAIALRAGAVMEDVEFVQFHPTVLWLGEEANGQQPLISEADFAAVQEKIKGAKGKTRSPANPKLWLSGLIYCGTGTPLPDRPGEFDGCGKRMVGWATPWKKKSLLHYVCSQYRMFTTHNPTGCHAHATDHDKICSYLDRYLEDIGRLTETLTVGDGANDLAMLGEAGLGVAFRAKPAVAAAAHARIDHGDLTALLYLQGFAAAEFVT